MNLVVSMVFSLETGKRKSRFAEVFDPLTWAAIDSELPRRLLLPTKLPQEWLPAELRTGASGPVRRWVDRSLFEADDDDAPEGLPS